MADETLARVAHVYEAEPGDVCTLSMCDRDGACRIGWAPAGDEPTRTHPYCRYHASPWVKLGPDRRNPVTPPGHDHHEDSPF